MKLYPFLACLFIFFVYNPLKAQTPIEQQVVIILPYIKLLRMTVDRLLDTSLKVMPVKYSLKPLKTAN